jgi:hypothetical protein
VNNPILATAIETHRPGVSLCPEMWIMQWWDGTKWCTGVCHEQRSFVEAVYGNHKTRRLIRIPSEGEVKQ